MADSKKAVKNVIQYPYSRSVKSIGVFVGVAIALKFFFNDSLADTNLLNLTLFHACVGIGFYYIFGVSGQFAFSQAAMVGVGAYTSGWASRGLPFSGAFVVAVVVTSVVGALFVLSLRKASHFYFGIGTLAIAESYGVIAGQWRAFTNADGGEVYGLKPISVNGLNLSEDSRAFWVLLFFMLLVLVAGVCIERSPVVRESKAVRDQRVVASTLGIPHLRSRVAMFVFGSAIAGGFGSIYAHWKSGMSPGDFGLELGLGVFLIVILGGVSSKWGALLGAIFYTWMPEILSSALEFKMMVYGTVLLLVIIRLPDGLLGVGEVVMSRVRPHKTGNMKGVGTRTSAPAELPKSLAPMPQASPLVIQAQGLTVAFGGNTAVNNIDLDFNAGEILGLIGPNGSGKSTFLNAITGVVPATGNVQVFGKELTLETPSALRKLGVSRTYQAPQTYLKLTCLEDVLLSTSDRQYTGIFAALLRRKTMLRHEQERWKIANEAIEWVGLGPIATSKVSSLTYGQRRLLELARAVAARTPALLLDEPSAGLNATETEVLAGYLKELHKAGVSILIVDHKVDFLNSICDRIAVLNIGSLVMVGTVEQVWNDARVIDAYLGVD